jgi:transcriptional regulator with XRE-family HTH domain
MNTREEVNLGNFIWAHRLGEEMTQTEFAKMLGISKQRLCDIEKNRSNVSIKMCKLLAEKLGFSASWFVRLELERQFKKEGLDLSFESKSKS